MAALKAHEVARYIKRPDLTAGVFLVYGPDTGLVHETALALIRTLVQADAEILVLDASELDADPGRLAVEARMGSLFGGRRLLRVRGAGKSLVPVLRELCADPGEAIIVLEAGNLVPKDGLRALVETAPAGRALPCYADSNETLDAIIRESFSKAGIRVDNDVIPALRDNLGNDREITRRELEKLSLFAMSSKSLSMADMLALSADSAALAMDEIIDAAGTGHAERLELALSRALLGAIDPQRLLAIATQHIANLRQLRVEVDAGKSARQVLEGMRPRVHFTRTAALEQQLRLWDDAALADAEARLHTAVAESRRRPGLAEPCMRRTLLGLCMMAAGR